MLCLVFSNLEPIFPNPTTKYDFILYLFSFLNDKKGIESFINVVKLKKASYKVLIFLL